MKTFTMNDLSKLVEIIGSSSASDDRLPAFLAKFDFVDKYETDDDSIVYVTGNNKGLEIEFFNIDSVYNRTISVLYRETPESRFTVLEWEDLKKIYCGRKPSFLFYTFNYFNSKYISFVSSIYTKYYSKFCAI